jgi:hypothetical protein
VIYLPIRISQPPYRFFCSGKKKHKKCLRRTRGPTCQLAGRRRSHAARLSRVPTIPSPGRVLPRDPNQSHGSARKKPIPAVGCAARTAAAPPAQRPPRLARASTRRAPIGPGRTHDVPANATGAARSRAPVHGNPLYKPGAPLSPPLHQIRQAQFETEDQKPLPRREEKLPEERERAGAAAGRGAAMDRVRGSAFLLAVLLAGTTRSRLVPPAVSLGGFACSFVLFATGSAIGIGLLLLWPRSAMFTYEWIG